MHFFIYFIALLHYSGYLNNYFLFISFGYWVDKIMLWLFCIFEFDYIFFKIIFTSMELSILFIGESILELCEIIGLDQGWILSFLLYFIYGFLLNYLDWLYFFLVPSQI